MRVHIKVKIKASDLIQVLFWLKNKRIMVMHCAMLMNGVQSNTAGKGCIMFLSILNDANQC